MKDANVTRIYSTIDEANVACAWDINVRMNRAIGLASTLSDAFISVIKSRNPKLIGTINAEDFKLDYFYCLIKNEIIPLYSSYFDPSIFLARRLSEFPSETDKNNTDIEEQITINIKTLETDLENWFAKTEWVEDQVDKDQTSKSNSYVKEWVAKVKENISDSFKDATFETKVEYLAELAKYAFQKDHSFIIPYVLKDSSSEINGYEFVAMLVYFIDCCCDKKISPSEWWFTDSEARAKRYSFTPEDLVILDAFFLAWGKNNEPKEKK